MYVPTKYIATIIILLLSQLYIWDAIYSLHGYRLSRSLHPYLSTLELRPISGLQVAGLHSPSHAYQLYQRPNDGAGWTAAFEPHRKTKFVIDHTPQSLDDIFLIWLDSLITSFFWEMNQTYAVFPRTVDWAYTCSDSLVVLCHVMSSLWSTNWTIEESPHDIFLFFTTRDVDTT